MKTTQHTNFITKTLSPRTPQENKNFIAKSSSQTIHQCLSQNKDIFYRDREFILQNILNKSRSELYTLDRCLTELEFEKYMLFCHKYQQGYPLAYLLKETQFYGHHFRVEPNVFIPRVDTETLVDSVIRFHSNLLEKRFNFIDFGCGSGCVGLSLLLHFKKAHLFSVDLNPQALHLTQQNAQNLDVQKRVSLIQSSVCDLKVQKFSPMTFIVANPPYVDEKDEKLSESVRKHEPHLALFSQNKGRQHIEKWLLKGRSFFQNHQEMQSYFFEIGYDQHEFVCDLLKNDSVEYIRDSQGIYRVVHFKREHQNG